jgi:glycosyltransferase involved in cell wall biosynthesis
MSDSVNFKNSEKREIQKSVGENVKKTPPAVSVIIPAYKIAGFIAESLESVFAQAFEDYEIILINDGSPDTAEFEKAVAPFRDKIIYLENENCGASISRNIAIENSRGEFLAFLDGDDIWKTNYLESQTDFLKANNLEMVYCDAELFGGSVYDGRNYMQTSPSNGKVNFESLLNLECNVITSGTIAKRETVLKAGMFEWERNRAHDFVLWLKIARNGARIGYQKKVLLKYRVRADSLSGDSKQRVQREIDVFYRVEKLFALTEDQTKIVENHLSRLEADLQIEKGKSYLLQENFEAAKSAFEQANDYRRSNRLRLIIWLIRFAPHLLLKIYQTRRSEEIAFVPK